MRTQLANPKGFEALLTPPQADDSFSVTLRRNATARTASTSVDTVTGQGRYHWLVISYRIAGTKSAGEPLHTLGTKDSAALRWASCCDTGSGGAGTENAAAGGVASLLSVGGHSKERRA
ncbi:hypothetical protein [Streptomyces griseosporeus]|uniref:hypothetical protein n=1 Tax=Streptomyces griseosporeus TaxID=1910 RepID=UPI00167D5556|nr:hypothetical protein [Streptomyces griseosporeus]